MSNHILKGIEVDRVEYISFKDLIVYLQATADGLPRATEGRAAILVLIDKLTENDAYAMPIGKYAKVK